MSIPPNEHSLVPPLPSLISSVLAVSLLPTIKTK